MLPSFFFQAMMSELTIQNEKLSGISPTSCQLELRMHLVSILKMTICWCRYKILSVFPHQRALVHTSETTRLRYFVELLLEKGQPLMLVGNAGVGKTVFVGDMLAGLSEAYIVSHVPFNYYTTSAALQRKCSSSSTPETRPDTIRARICSPKR